MNEGLKEGPKSLQVIIIHTSRSQAVESENQNNTPSQETGPQSSFGGQNSLRTLGLYWPPYLLEGGCQLVPKATR